MSDATSLDQGAGPVGPASFASALARRPYAVLAGIVLLGFVLRALGMVDAWLNPDEGIYYSMTTWRDPAKFWDELAANAHPPLYYLLLRGIGGLTPDFWWYRFVSVVSGTLAIPALYAFARSLWGARKGEQGRAAETGVALALIASLALAVAPGHIAMSQIIRPYAFLTCTLALAFAAAAAYLRGARAWVLVIYLLSLAAALLTHYSAFLVGPALAWLVAHAWWTRALRGRRLAVFAGVQIVPLAIVIGLYFWHLRPKLIDSELADQALATGGWLTPFLIDSISGFWTHTVGALGFASGVNAEFATTLAFVVGSACLALRREWRTLLLVAAIWLVAAFASASGKYPFGASRHSSWTLVFFVLPVAYAAEALVRTRAFVLPVVLAACALPSFLLRDELARALRFGETPQQVVTEDPVAYASVRRFLAAPQTEIDAKSGHIVMDMQSYYTLLPLYQRPREFATFAPSEGGDPPAMFFGWGRREVSVAWRWQLSVVAAHAGKPEHILELLRARGAFEEARDIEAGARLAAQDEILWIWAGWPSPSPHVLARADAQRPEGERWIRSSVVAPGITVYRFALGDFLKAMRQGR